MKVLFAFALVLLGYAPVIANAQSISVSRPANGAYVGNSFALTASAAPCWSQSIAAMGYSIDNGDTTAFYAASINVQVAAPSGTHILHVKSWGNQGAGCVSDVLIQVSDNAASASVTDMTVSRPSSGSTLVSPFALKASETLCKSQPVAAMGYSIDDYGDAAAVYGSTLDIQAHSALGAHVLHVKSWGNQGASCVSDIAVNVVPSPVSMLPSNAIGVHSIQTLTNWQAESDAGAGTANGASTYGYSNLVYSAISGLGREFKTSYSHYGGERYYTSFGADTAATHFLYDGWFYLPYPSNNIGLLEFDMNQVMANGQTVIFGFQCDSWSKTWDYTANAGSPENFSDVWIHSAAPCDIQNWETNTWHHVQISYSRDGWGNVTYQSVWLDNVQQDLNVTVPSSFALGWSPTLLTNFQVDGYTDAPASVTVFADNLSVYRW